MAGRRRTTRFMLDTAVEATLCVHHPVVVDSFVGEEMWITSEFPAARNDLYALSRVGSNPTSNFRLRVEECEPIVVNGRVRNRVRLTSALDHGPMASAVVGVLTRTLSVRIVQVSDGGCLLESPCRLDVGAGAELRVALEGETWADHIRVRHCSQTAAGDGAHLTGAEFVWSRPVHHACLRNVLGRRNPDAQAAASDGRRKLGIVH